MADEENAQTQSVRVWGRVRRREIGEKEWRAEIRDGDRNRVDTWEYGSEGVNRQGDKGSYADGKG